MSDYPNPPVKGGAIVYLTVDGAVKAVEFYKKAFAGEVAWVIGPDGNVERRPVKTGSVTGDSMAVLEGLQPGDRIAVAGVQFLHEGMKVRDLGDQLEGNRL